MSIYNSSVAVFYICLVKGGRSVCRMVMGEELEKEGEEEYEGLRGGRTGGEQGGVWREEEGRKNDEYMGVRKQGAERNGEAKRGERDERVWGKGRDKVMGRNVGDRDERERNKGQEERKWEGSGKKDVDVIQEALRDKKCLVHCPLKRKFDELRESARGRILVPEKRWKMLLEKERMLEAFVARTRVGIMTLGEEVAKGRYAQEEGRTGRREEGGGEGRRGGGRVDEQ